MSTSSSHPFQALLRSVPAFDMRRLDVALRTAGPSLLFGLRLWACVCLALYVAFKLELDNPFWAGTSAAVVCQPQLGASLRKSWFRIIGTLIGAVMSVVLTACFPQDRVAFLTVLALWIAVCAFVATMLRNFASYSASLAGYTVAIIVTDALGATGGGPHMDVFMLSVTRASEICIGIACAGVVLAGTDLGSARQRLAASFAGLAAEIAAGFSTTLALAGRQGSDARPLRRALLARVIALDPGVDVALGESSQLRHHAPVLQMAVHGLFRAIDGWRGGATHLMRLPDDAAREGADTIQRNLPAGLWAALNARAPGQWMADPAALRGACQKAVLTLRSLPAGAPSLRLLADQTIKLLSGIVHVLDGLALLSNDRGGAFSSHRRLPLFVPDWLPSFVNAARAVFVVGATTLFWIATAWPGGASAVAFSAIIVVLLSPRGDLAYLSAVAFIIGIVFAVIGAAIIKFGVLPGLETFPAFCLAIGLFLVPLGFAVAHVRQRAVLAALSAMAFIFVAALQPTNQMVYNTQQFYNFVLAVLVGFGTGALSFRLLPPLPPELRTRRLLSFALRDLRRLAIGPVPSLIAWESRNYSRLSALPDKAEPLQRAQLLAALSVGAEIIALRHISARSSLDPELSAALAALARGDGGEARAQLARLEHRLAASSDTDPAMPHALRTRAGILAVSETLAEHAAYFEGRVPT